MIVLKSYISNSIVGSSRHLSTLQLFNSLLGENVTPEEKKEIDRLYYSSSFYKKPKSKKYNKSKSKNKPESALFARHRIEKSKYFEKKVTPTQKYKFSIIHVYANINNTIVTLIDVNGKTLGWSSCGCNEFKKAKRSSGYAAEVTGQAIGKVARGNRIKYVQLNIKGAGLGRTAVVKGVRSSGLIVTRLKDTSKVSYNGCRSKKLRRV